ncbi:hypothetical protein ACSTDE_05505 [Enterobacter hormaechei]|uniref:hypothetical protein n=1 Tax=Enterobacter hormaechei TaxID=158836 RepID=UPI001F44F9FA|nr:hypothetical protein [Enterobacter hormaechei]MDV5713838.1 hypothetical protein [Enterobacter hormaechei]
MSTFTKEQLIEKLQHRISVASGFPESEKAQIDLELARIALASLETEAVAWRYRFVHTPKSEEHGSPFTTDWVLAHSEEECNPSDCFERQPLYTAPPAPVSVPDEEQCKPHPVMAVKGELGFLDHFDRIISERDEDIDIGQLGSSNYEALMLAALDAFRAAMFQGANGKKVEGIFVSKSSEMSVSDITINGVNGGESRCSNSPVITGCSCRNCRPVTMTDMRFVVCPECGNKRCPHANDHRNACTGSNEPGQEGSAYPAAPQQEAK